MTDSETLFWASISLICLICITTICRTSSFVSGVNITISSIRFRNSGRIVCFIRSKTSFFVSSSALCGTESFVSVNFDSLSMMMCEPMFDVMMMIVLRKSTVRPLLSVSRPSSST